MTRNLQTILLTIIAALLLGQLCLTGYMLEEIRSFHPEVHKTYNVATMRGPLVIYDNPIDGKKAEGNPAGVVNAK